MSWPSLFEARSLCDLAPQVTDYAFVNAFLRSTIFTRSDMIRLSSKSFGV